MISDNHLPVDTLEYWVNAVKVYERDFSAALTTANLYGSCIRSQYATAKRKVKEKEEEYQAAIKIPSEEDVHLYYKYYVCYEYGIEYIQAEDENVFPRDIRKPVIHKGEVVVCYEYPAEDYKLIKTR